MTDLKAADHAAALLRALFPETSGDVLLSYDDTELRSRDLDEIEAFVTASAEFSITLDLVTADGEIAALSFIRDLDDDAGIDTLFERCGDPFVAVTDGASVAFVYPAKTISGDVDEAEMAMPVPGTGGWLLTEGSLEKLYAEESQDPEADDAAPAEAEQSSAEAATWNDATLPFGFPDEAVLELPIVMGLGGRKDDKRWPDAKMKFGELVHLLTQHTVGQKDGKAFLQGTAVDYQRVARAMKQMAVLGLDIDSGFDIDTVVARLRELNLAAVVYTTHSHMKPETHVTQASFAKWAKKAGEDSEPTDDTMRRFLRDARHWEERIASTAKVGETHQTVEGVGYIVSHAPMPKFRVVFPLAQAYVFSKQKMLQIEAINRWKARLLGLAKIVGVPIDESCLDPSRLFYLPRHTKGQPFSVVVTAGNALDFDAVPEINTRSREQPEDDFLERAAKALGAGVGTLTFDGFSLRGWAAKSAETFQMAEMFRAVAEERIRSDNNTGKLEIECPFDHEHSNPGDPDDRACYVVDAHSGDRASGFAWGCQHNSCKSRNRLEFVCQALEARWFTTDDLTNESFQAITVDGGERYIDPNQLVAELDQRIGMLTGSGAEDAVLANAIVKEGVEGGLDKFRLSILEEALVNKGFAKKAVASMIHGMQRTQSNGEDNAAKIARLLRLSNIEKLAGCDYVVMDETFGYDKQREAMVLRLKTMNAVNPRFFEYGGDRVVVTKLAHDPEVKVDDLGWERLADEFADTLRFYKNADNLLISVPAPDRLLKEVCVAKSWIAPKLGGFMRLPYFSSEGVLIVEPGFNPQTTYYLNSALEADLAVPSKPTKAQVEAARDLLLKEVYGDFPFDDGPDSETTGAASRAHFLCLLLQPFVRPLISGPTPIYWVSKPKAGTGASLLIGTGLSIATGKKAGTQSESTSDEEIRKGITSAFRSGQTAYWLDNINSEMRSTAYANLATSATWDDRLLGKSETVSFDNKMMFIVGGNNPRGTGEIMRRALPIHMDAKEDPLKREDFRIEDLEGWVIENRKRLIEALITLVQAWIAAGKPLFRERKMASFEGYTKVMGGILEVIGVPGFLTNLNLTLKYADEETRSWESLFQRWVDDDKKGMGRECSAQEIAAMMIDMPDFPAIGVRFSDEAKALAPRVRDKLDSKRGTPYEVTLKDTRRTVCIRRTQNRKTSQYTYALVHMPPKEKPAAAA